MTETIFEYVYEGVRLAHWKNTVSLIVVSIMGVCELISSLILIVLARKAK